MTLFNLQNQITVKVVALLTMLVMVVSLVPASVFAEAEGDAQVEPAADQSVVAPVGGDDENNKNTDKKTEKKDAEQSTSSENLPLLDQESDLESALFFQLPKVWICHANNSNENANNPYGYKEVSVLGLNGHGDHEDDIIPSFAYGLYPGKNLNTVYSEFDGLTGQEILDLKCKIPEPEQEQDISTVIVRPSALNGWVRTGTDGGQTTFFADANAVLGDGTLKLSSDTNTSARANVSKNVDVLLKDLSGLSYKTKQNTAIPEGNASYRISFDADGSSATTNDRATLIHEPYWQNGGLGDAAPVVNGVWQTWNVDNGIFWASISGANQPQLPLLTNGAGGPPFYSIDDVVGFYPNAKVTAFSVGIGSNNPSYNIDVDAVVFGTETPELLTKTTYDFQPDPVVPPPQCDLGAETVADTTFDTFTLGNVNGQNSWNSTGAFDQEVVTNTYGFVTFGCKSLRISNAVTSGSFGDQTFAAPLTDSVGETIATNGAFPIGTRYNRFEAQFDIASTKQTQQTGLRMTVSPDRGDGSRMSFLAFQDTASGIDIVFNEVQGTASPVSFVPTTIATIDRNPHTIKLVINTNEGPSNDVVEVYVDGVLEHTGTSWENYYRFDNEASAEQTPRLIKTLLFRSSGAAAPATDGDGFLFDNMSLKAMNQPAQEQEVTIVATKLVCEDESDLPNWGNGGPAITAETAADWVEDSEGACDFASDWEFQYADQNGPDTAGDFVGEDENYTTFEDATDENGVTTQTILLNKGVTELHLREVLQDGYLPFSKDNEDDVSAEFYCADDVLNYDNWDFIRNPQAGETYYCVAWNVPAEVPEVPVCDMGENLIQNGSFEITPVVTANGGKWQIFAGGVLNWIASLSSGLEVWNNFNGTGAGLASDGVQNVELDGDDATRITQTIATIPGATYELKYDFSPRATIGAADNVMAVLVDGSTVDTINGDGTANTGNVWAPKTKTFVATGTSTDIAFEDAGTANDNGGYGPLLDNVSVCMTKKAPPVCSLTITSDATDYVAEKNAAAKLMSYIHPSWVTAIGTSTAAWIWGDNPVVSPTTAETQTFKKGFNWTGGTVTSATLKLASDNSHAVTLGSFTGGNPGEFNYGAVTSYNVASGITAGANTLEIEVENFAQANGTQTSNPAGLIYELTVTGTGESCGVVDPIEPIPAVTLNATKVVCDTAEAMPNGNITRPITAQTAAAWVANSNGACRFQSGWEFEWGNAGAGNGGDTTIGSAPNYTTFGPTNANGFTSTLVPFANLNGRIEVREVLKDGYVPFSSNLDAEFYCHTDAAGTDNWDWINSPVDGGTYNCVAFNMLADDGGNDNDPETYILDGYKYACTNDHDSRSYINDYEQEYYNCDTEDIVPGWTIYARNGDNAPISTTTDQYGYYYFEVEEGDWTVYEAEEGEDWEQVSVEQNGYELVGSECSFEIGDDTIWEYARSLWDDSEEDFYRCDFYNYFYDEYTPQTYTVTGVKWNDVDGDGTKDEDESKLPNWTITAVKGLTSISTTTDVNGNYTLILPYEPGQWVISETQQSGWTQTGLYENGVKVTLGGEVSNNCSFELGIQEPSASCDFGNKQNTVVTEEPTSNRGGGGGGTRVTNRATPQGLVLGAATSSCGMYLQDYMRMGNAASTTQVTKLQVFLNAVGITAPLTGIFDAATDAAVRTFQAQHKAEVLTPWYLAKIVPHENPTGWVYQLTRWKINNIVCPGSEAYPVLN